MTRIGLLSDTHGVYDPKFATHFEQCDEIWHAGDIGDYSVVEGLRSIHPGITLRCVAGNIDGADIRREFGEVQSFKVEDVGVWMTHICGYPGKYAPGVMTQIREEKPTIIVGGHSHILKVQYDNNLNALYLNPGASGYHGWHKVRTLMRFVINGPEIKDLEVIELAERKLSL